MLQVIPNSHFWTDLNQIIATIEHHYQRMAYESEKHDGDEYTVKYVNEPLNKEYILIGLNNSKKNGYKLKSIFNEYVRILHSEKSVFVSIEHMIEFVESKEFILKYDFVDFEEIIKHTLECGLNLTNGLKMNRQEVYKRIDGERDYQDLTWVARRTADGTPDEEKDVAEWINYMEFHLQKAKNAVYYLKTEEALAEVRKVTALGVRTIEIHGCPEREMPEVKNGDDINSVPSWNHTGSITTTDCCKDDCNCKKTE
jgi:hypothetical protein